MTVEKMFGTDTLGARDYCAKTRSKGPSIAHIPKKAVRPKDEVKAGEFFLYNTDLARMQDDPQERLDCAAYSNGHPIGWDEIPERVVVCTFNKWY